jgi:hypothetical protein
VVIPFAARGLSETRVPGSLLFAKKSDLIIISQQRGIALNIRGDYMSRYEKKELIRMATRNLKLAQQYRAAGRIGQAKLVEKRANAAWRRIND